MTPPTQSDRVDNRLRCVLVIPCYNEAKRLPAGAIVAFAEKNPSIRLMFVNDGSTDGTLPLLRSLAAKLPPGVEVLDCPVNGGKAEAVRQGMLQALDKSDAPVVGFWDADMATPLDASLGLLETLDARPDIHMVFGARVKLLGREIERNPLRHYLGRTFATAVSIVLGMPIYDTQCGAKLFRADDRLRQVLRERFGSRWIFDVEIIARFIQMDGGDSARLAASIYEYPLMVWRDIAGSKVRPTDFLKAFKELVAIYLRYRR